MAAAMSLLRRNLAQPFSLTLLNIGATGFSAQQQPGGAMPPVFARLLSRGDAAAVPSAGGALMSAGTGAAPQDSNGRAAAATAIAQRRDYGASPQGLPLTKSGERQLSESARPILPPCGMQQARMRPCAEEEEEEEEDAPPQGGRPQRSTSAPAGQPDRGGSRTPAANPGTTTLQQELRELQQAFAGSAAPQTDQPPDSQELADRRMAEALQREELLAHQKRSALHVAAPSKKAARLNTLDAFVRRRA